jgi:hypothetical protein
LQSDENSLTSSPVLPMNFRNALIVRIGEKRILRRARARLLEIQKKLEDLEAQSGGKSKVNNVERSESRSVKKRKRDIDNEEDKGSSSSKGRKGRM